jgi:hypothetical protein
MSKLRLATFLAMSTIVISLVPGHVAGTCTPETPCVCPQELIAAGDEYYLYYAHYCPWELGDGEWASPTNHTNLPGMCSTTPMGPCIYLVHDGKHAVKQASLRNHEVEGEIRANGLRQGGIEQFSPTKVVRNDNLDKLKNIRFHEDQTHVTVQPENRQQPFYANIFCLSYEVKEDETGMTRYVASGFTVSNAPTNGPRITEAKMVGDYVCVLRYKGIFYTVLLHRP